MNRQTLAWALTGALAFAIPALPAAAMDESYEARETAANAVDRAKRDMLTTFRKASLENGKYLFAPGGQNSEVTRVVVSLNDQLAFAYSGSQLVAVTTISSGTSSNPTPTGIFPIMEKKRLHHSIRYDNAPMPYMQRLDNYGVAMHAGNLPGRPASHGCIRLPERFASWLFGATDVGTQVLIGARVKQPTLALASRN